MFRFRRDSIFEVERMDLYSVKVSTLKSTTFLRRALSLDSKI
jgi:hypothetical protein